MLNFDFLEKGVGIVSQPDFVYNFSRKTFLMFFSTNDQILLPDCFYFLGYRAIYVQQFFVNQAVTS